MARRKLTLTVDEKLIRRAKRFSKRHGKSVSQLVTEFLSSLDAPHSFDSPIVGRLRGVLPETSSRAEYYQHLEDKHGS